MAKQHSPEFLKLVQDAKTRIKECTVADVKRRLDAGDQFLLVDVREESEDLLVPLRLRPVDADSPGVHAVERERRGEARPGDRPHGAELRRQLRLDVLHPGHL